MNKPQINIEAVAKLARLSFGDDEKAALYDEMRAIIGFADKLGELDTADVPITAHVVPLSNVLREDIPEGSFERDALLSNAPTKADGFITVSRVVE